MAESPPPDPGRVPARLDATSPLETVRAVHAAMRAAADAVAAEEQAIARAVEVAADRLRAGGRLVYCGAGTLGRVGVLEAVDCLATFALPPGRVVGLIAGGMQALTWPVEGVADDRERGRRDLDALEVDASDAVVGTAADGATPWVLGAVARARELGAFAIGLCFRPGAPLAEAADLAITPELGPELLAGSARPGAATATAIVLSALGTGAMVALGKVFGNVVVDLVAAGGEAADRARRAVETATGLGGEQAARLLADCGGEARTAIVCGRLGVPPERARELLAASGGVVRRALGGG